MLAPLAEALVEPVDRDAALLGRLARADVNRAVLERLLAHCDTHRNPDQVGVGELLPRPLIAVVQEHLVAGVVELRRHLLGALLEARQADHVHVVGSHRPRPFDALLVVVLLDDGRHGPRRPDAVAAHDERLLLAVLVQKRRLERRRVVRLKLEDVADLDRSLKVKSAAAPRTGVSLLHFPDVREARLVIAPGLDATKMPTGAIRTGYVLTLLEELVGDDLHRGPNGTDRAAVRAEGLPDLLGMGGSEGRV